METRANYVLVGAFAVAGFLGILGFFLWFANIELNRQFAYYDVDFVTISGLGEASDVRFAGLPVGQVVSVALSPENDGRVRVRIEIDGETPVRTDSVATIEAQGVTGVSFVGITAGSPDQPLLNEVSERAVPHIEAGQSVLQSLSEDAPEILAETLALLRDFRATFDESNQQKVQNILENAETSSASFSQALEDFADVTGTVSDFAEEIARFNTTLEALSRDLSGVLIEAETALTGIDAMTQDARGLIARGAESLTRADSVLVSADTFIAENLGPTTQALGQAIADIRGRVDTLAEGAETLTATFTETGLTATARLTEAGETLKATDTLIASIERTLRSVDGAATRLDGMMAGDVDALISELRVATAEATEVIRTVGAVAEGDLTAIFEDIRDATRSANATISSVGADLTATAEQLGGLTGSAAQTLEDVRTTFANANETLSAINAALETGNRALTVAERTFASAETVITEDVAIIVEQLRSTLDALESTVGSVAQEIPSIAQELRAASQSAESAFAGIEGAVDTSAPAIRDFATTALPQYGRLAVETRALIENLDTLFEQIRRDPSRFFLQPGAPEYKR